MTIATTTIQTTTTRLSVSVGSSKSSGRVRGRETVALRNNNSNEGNTVVRGNAFSSSPSLFLCSKEDKEEGRRRRRRMPRRPTAAFGKDDNRDGFKDVSNIMKKYSKEVPKDVTKVVGTAVNVLGNNNQNNKQNEYNGVFALLFFNFLFFALDHWLQLPMMKMFYLNHVDPTWWQFVTCTFCHASWDHLSSNIFFLYIFGKLIEEEEGAFGVWCSYVATGTGASLASWLMLPKSVGGVLGMGAAATVSLGASGAVFGLFAVSVLVKLKFEWKRILEVVVLGQFVMERFLNEAAMIGKVGGVGAGGVNHVAHLAGALAGVVLIALLSKILPE
tara:strand:- start:1098 stop:2090 length:993 start_codon:yes stop_codon:yes gene_type:complete